MSNSPKPRSNAAVLLLLVLIPILAILVYTKFMSGDNRIAEEKAAFDALTAKQFEGEPAYLVIGESILDADGEKVAEKKVTSVNFRGHPADEEVFKQVGKLFRLNTLNADNCDIKAEHLKHLTGMDKLINLILSNTPITDEGLAHIKSLDSVESLYLTGTNITNAGLDHLAPLKNLKILNLSTTKVDDGGLEKLLVFNKLEHLLLVDTEVTDAGLDTLAKIGSLGRLSLNGAKVTPQGVEKLKKSNPRLQIDYAPPKEEQPEAREEP